MGRKYRRSLAPVTSNSTTYHYQHRSPLDCLLNIPLAPTVMSFTSSTSSTSTLHTAITYQEVPDGFIHDPSARSQPLTANVLHGSYCPQAVALIDLFSTGSMVPDCTVASGKPFRPFFLLSKQTETSNSSASSGWESACSKHFRRSTRPASTPTG